MMIKIISRVRGKSQQMYLSSFLSRTPPKSPKGGLVMKFNPLYPPFGGNFRGQARNGEKKIKFLEIPYNYFEIIDI
jgi:hypothetical protein